MTDEERRAWCENAQAVLAKIAQMTDDDGEPPETMEQMMRGGVVIASDIGVLAEVVGEAGLRFKAGDSDNLYSRLREVIESPSLRASLSLAARRRALRSRATSLIASAPRRNPGPGPAL